ncbi:hypothetical protein M3Y97_00754600 [Aphelenchoides bicaudatus]|nr:hypothetical protein M3Y97_00754600 [Aphelenchoides bicaudatus]
MCNCFSCCSERMRRYVFWILIAFLTVLTINDIVTLLMEYLEFPKIADMSYTQNETMKFPAFTVCIPTPMVLSIFNSSIFNKEDKLKPEEAIKKSLSKMKTSKDFLSMDWDWRMVEDAYKTIAQIHTLERETDDSFVGRKLLKFQKQNQKNKVLAKFQHWRDILKKRDVSFQDFMQKTGDEVLKRMIKKSEKSSMDNDDIYNSTYKVTWISEPNLCFQPQFNGNASGMITAAGRFFFMKIGHDPRKLDGPKNIVVDLNGRPANMANFEDAGGHTTEGVNSGIQSGTMSQLLVEVRAVYELLENDDPGTRCIDLDNDANEEDDGEFTPVFQCLSRCRTELIREICKCTPISTEHLVEDKEDLKIYPVCDYTKCHIQNDTERLHEKNCLQKCRHGCTMTRYTLKMLETHPAINFHPVTHQPMQAPNQTAFNLVWGAFEFLHMEQSYKYESFVSFLSELGGSLGIWLGLSVLSLLQGSVYVTEKVTTKVQTRRSKSSSAAQPKPSNDKKFSQNPFGGTKVSENPFSDIYSASSGPKKRSTASGGSANK